MELPEALAWAQARTHAVLITLRRDGRAQSSDVVYGVVDGAFHVSLTADRAKTANMKRDPRVIFHLTEPSSWSYLSFDATVELSPVCAAPDDPTVDQLADLFRIVAGHEHEDWDEFRAAMVADRRLLARVVPTSVTGQAH